MKERINGIDFFFPNLLTNGRQIKTAPTRNADLEVAAFYSLVDLWAETIESSKTNDNTCRQENENNTMKI